MTEASLVIIWLFFFFLRNKSGNQSERTIRFINVWGHIRASLNNSHFQNRAECKTELLHENNKSFSFISMASIRTQTRDSL